MTPREDNLREETESIRRPDLVPLTEYFRVRVSLEDMRGRSTLSSSIAVTVAEPILQGRKCTDYSMYAIHCILYAIYYILYAIHYTLYGVCYTLHYVFYRLHDYITMLMLHVYTLHYCITVHINTLSQCVMQHEQTKQI